MFFFDCGLYPELPPDQQIHSLCQFAQSSAAVVNNFLDYDILLSGVIATGGPVFSGCIGLSHTLFDVWGDIYDFNNSIVYTLPISKLYANEESLQYLKVEYSKEPEDFSQLANQPFNAYEILI